MNKKEKELVLNGVNNYSFELVDRWLPLIRSACKFGLHKGKIGNIEWISSRLRELADELDAYADESFTLHDMQDYDGGF